MTYSLIILFHFLNISIGFTALVLFSRRPSTVSPAIQKAFIQQVLAYNIAILITAVSDFLYFFFWKEVSKNSVALGFLSIINVSNLAIAILWCMAFAIMIYKFLEIPFDRRYKTFFKYIAWTIVLFLIYCIITLLLNVYTQFFITASLISGYTIAVVILTYSVFLYKKTESIENSGRKNSLKLFSIIFIFFSLCNLFIFINAYPLHLVPGVIVKFSFCGLDLIFNICTFLWAFKYFHLLGTQTEPINIENVSEEQLITKYQISKRELEVIHLICAGKSNQEIADLLFISIGTVKNHLYNIYAKIGVKNRTQLAKLF
ncbi:MAG: hypothetical protein C0412_17750 [Flavobacterium sp.]|nr:hypothetical protein [Flavobacterium sp.]